MHTRVLGFIEYHEAWLGLLHLVFDKDDVEEVLALVAAGELLIAVELESHATTFRHLLGGQALEGADRCT